MKVESQDKPKKRIPKPDDFQPEQCFPHDHPTWPGKPRCQSWNPNEGRQCCNPAMVGKIRCGSHGGRTPIGASSPHFRHGAYSRAIPKGIKADYLGALNDPRLLSLKQDIATVDARLSQIFKAIDAHETPEFIESTKANAESILQALAAYRQAALKSRDSKDEGIKLQAAADMRNTLVSIEETAQALLTQAHNSQESATLWKEAYNVIEQRRKLVESESRLQIELRQTITKERALILFGAMVEQFRQVLSATVEPETAKGIMLQIATRTTKLLEGGDNQD